LSVHPFFYNLFVPQVFQFYSTLECCIRRCLKVFFCLLFHSATPTPTSLSPTPAVPSQPTPPRSDPHPQYSCRTCPTYTSQLVSCSPHCISSPSTSKEYLMDVPQGPGCPQSPYLSPRPRSPGAGLPPRELQTHSPRRLFPLPAASPSDQQSGSRSTDDGLSHGRSGFPPPPASLRGYVCDPYPLLLFVPPAGPPPPHFPVTFIIWSPDLTFLLLTKGMPTVSAFESPLCWAKTTPVFRRQEKFTNLFSPDHKPRRSTF